MDYSPSQESGITEHKQTAAAAIPPTGDLIILTTQKIKACFILFKNIPLYSHKNICWQNPSQVQVPATNIPELQSEVAFF